MRETGNPSQWADSWPPSTLIEEDIIQQKSYVCVKSSSESATATKTEQVVAVFVLEIADDPAYHQIYQGQWLEPHQPYGVIHRLASSRRVQGAATLCLQWALEQCGNIRIDTHQANLPMRNLLQKLGYHYCGIIHTHDGTARLAYQKATKKAGSRQLFLGQAGASPSPYKRRHPPRLPPAPERSAGTTMQAAARPSGLAFRPPVSSPWRSRDLECQS